MDFVLSNVRLDGHRDALDVRVGGGVIQSIGKHSAIDPGVPRIDGKGELLLPGLVDSHCHVDKTLWGGEWVPHSAGPSVAERIANERDRRFEVGYPSMERTLALLRQMSSCGTTHIRTHTDVDPDIGLRGIEMVREATRLLEGAIDVQQVAFPQQGIVARPGTEELLREAARSGMVSAIGGVDPAGLDRDPGGHLDAIFRIACEANIGVDIHLHDPGDLGIWEMWRIIERTRSFGMSGRVAISHAFCWSGMSGPVQSAVLDALAELDISIVTSALFSLPVPPVRAFHDRGVTLACGNDGIRDLWSPYGTGDMLERAMHVAFRSDLRRDEDIGLALDCATRNGARMLGIDHYGLDVGCNADMVLVPADRAAEAVVMRPARSLVFKGGRIVAGKDKDDRRIEGDPR
ncbi:amidohydrolase [uncultured Castellaniella sp.]|uniref:amidohydrolase n=1 Tax=uncultured Castellaniella sp. TaxID=647907 RepID=UPI00260C2A02|nr:amidohydrolase [uncultured Castellaniella sp.]